MALRLIGEYLEAGKLTGGENIGAVSHESLDPPLFRPVANNRTGTLDRHLDPGSIYRKNAPATSRIATATKRMPFIRVQKRFDLILPPSCLPVSLESGVDLPTRRP